jgi:hypothetical protein
LTQRIAALVYYEQVLLVLCSTPLPYSGIPTVIDDSEKYVEAEGCDSEY